ncbi:MarR family winged helix-turn-helix transcriptional regulator [Roseobacter ponti]|uniref:Winged helix-turn-helix transcriptional regulator n=1 Tax=Roseobacter ponti TaxID=1891787 RepID=A0A858ST72_9RHOB|nr:MarR family winged helix-turn-helix transcriptional regulator [Roseobacter ponti]QJF51875.1 winged helix-turn-helix transcriptional regulator [Roseobacter ponti]
MSFVLPQFLPYLLNQAAEAVSRDFQGYYRDRYGMLRTEWRVLFHLGCYGEMTAGRICGLASIHKTKVSRAVRALEVKRYLRRTTSAQDRRVETLALTPSGQRVFRDLQAAAEQYERDITSVLSPTEVSSLRSMLLKLEKGAG